MKQSSGEIWRWNKEVEMNGMSDCLRNCRFIAIDTEFPGCLKETRFESSEEDRYRDMKFNVDNTKLIQMGLTLLDSEDKLMTWEINFSDFLESKDSKNVKSIDFLKKNGLNLDKIREQGIDIAEFFKDFAQILMEKKKKKKKTNWVTFDGSYDMAYVLKGLTGGNPLPETRQGFAEAVEKLCGKVFDVKKMAGRCHGLSCRYGLQRVADAFQIKRVGTAHHAGSDSELTARVFTKMTPILNQQYLYEQEQEKEQKLKQQQEQQLMMMIARRSYVSQQPRRPIPMMYAASYPPFRGYYVVPVQPMINYV